MALCALYSLCGTLQGWESSGFYFGSGKEVRAKGLALLVAGSF